MGKTRGARRLIPVSSSKPQQREEENQEKKLPTYTAQTVVNEEMSRSETSLPTLVNAALDDGSRRQFAKLAKT